MDELERIYAAPKSDLKRLNFDVSKFKKTIKYAKFMFRCWVIYCLIFGLVYLPTTLLRLLVFTNF